MPEKTRSQKRSMDSNGRPVQPYTRLRRLHTRRRAERTTAPSADVPLHRELEARQRIRRVPGVLLGSEAGPLRDAIRGPVSRASTTVRFAGRLG